MKCQEVKHCPLKKPVHHIEPCLENIVNWLAFSRAFWVLCGIDHLAAFESTISILLCIDMKGVMVVKHNIHIVSFYSWNYPMKYVEAVHPHFTVEENGDPKQLMDNVTKQLCGPTRWRVQVPCLPFMCLYILFFLMKVKIYQDSPCLFK